MKVSIIGQGYVGLTISVFAAAHHEVIGFDKNQGVVDALNAGRSHIEGVDSSDLARWIAAGRYKRPQMRQRLRVLMLLLLQCQHPLPKIVSQTFLLSKLHVKQSERV